MKNTHHASPIGVTPDSPASAGMDGSASLLPYQQAIVDGMMNGKPFRLPVGRIRHDLTKIAAEMAMCFSMPSDEPDDWQFCKTTPITDKAKAIVAARASHRQCKAWANHLRDVINELPNDPMHAPAPRTEVDEQSQSGCGLRDMACSISSLSPVQVAGHNLHGNHQKSDTRR